MKLSTYLKKGETWNGIVLAVSIPMYPSSVFTRAILFSQACKKIHVVIFTQYHQDKDSSKASLSGDRLGQKAGVPSWFHPDLDHTFSHGCTVPQGVLGVSN